MVDSHDVPSSAPPEASPEAPPEASREAPPADTPPSIGRIVHYVLPEGSPYAGAHRPAVITEVFDAGCNLLVFPSQVRDFGSAGDAAGPAPVAKCTVVCDEQHTPGTWHWPERV